MKKLILLLSVVVASTTLHGQTLDSLIALLKEGKVTMDSIKSFRKQEVFTKYNVDSIEKRFNELKANFNYNGDKYTGFGYYTHKEFAIEKIYHTNTIVASVDNLGEIHITSWYKGDDWIFHDNFKALIDGIVYSSPICDIPNRRVSNGSVTENCIYMNAFSTKTVAAIGSAKEDVSVKLYGKQGSEEFYLTKEQKQAFKAVSEIAPLIEILRTAGRL